MLPPTKPDAALFDLDDTLVDHTPALAAAFEAVIAMATKSQQRSLRHHFEKSASLHHQAAMRRRYLSQALHRSQSLRTLIPAFEQDFKTKIAETSPSIFYPGAAEFVLALKGKGARTCLVSRASDRAVAASLKGHVLDNTFDEVWSAPSLVHGYTNKQDIFKDIIDRLKFALERTPTVWAIGDYTSDFPSLSRHEPDFSGTEIFRIAASPRCDAYIDHPETSSGRNYVVTSYQDALQHLQNL